MLFEGHQRGSYRARMNARRRKLTPEEEADAHRLQKEWARKKKDGMTQEAVSAMCGWESQSAFSQYLNGVIPLNLEAVLRIARAIEVVPSDISPRLSELLPTSSLSPKALAFGRLYDECPQSGQPELVVMVERWVKGEKVESREKERT